MDTIRLLEALKKVKQANDVFLEQHEEELLGSLAKEDVSAKEALQQEIMTELLDKMQRINHIIRYLEKTKIMVGTLSRDKDGNILFNGSKMDPMEEFEVYLYDDHRGKVVWTRTFVCFSGKGEVPYLVGLSRGLKIDGIRARIRS